MTELLLKWEKNGLGTGMHSMLKSRELVDVTIVCQGEIIQAHKTVLAACSQHFKRTFMINPCQHPIVIMQDVLLVHLRSLLDFMYKGEAKVKQKDMRKFMRTAEALKISGLAANADTSDEETELYELFDEDDDATENFSKKLSRKHNKSSEESSHNVEENDFGNDHDNSQSDSNGGGDNGDNTQSSPMRVDHTNTGEFLQTWTEEVVTGDVQSEVQEAVTNIVVDESMLVNEDNPSTSQMTIISEAELASALIKSEFVAVPSSGALPINVSALRKSKNKKKRQVTQTIVNPTAVTLFAQKHEKIPCPICNLEFTTVKYRDRHVRNSHTPGGPQEWTCSFCKKVLKNKDKLETHMRLFHMSRMVNSRYECSICSKSYKSRAVLIKHQKHTHENYKADVSCAICQKQFNYVDTMRAHMRKAHNYYSRPNCRKDKKGDSGAKK